ncbi:MAG: histidine kinase [Bacteroidia bacterium]|nr:histidine kinase [Bacteroidia bacterium]
MKEVLQKQLLGIRLGEYLAVLGFYLFSGSLYLLALMANSNFEWFPWKAVILDYSLKLLLTSGIWWLVFRVVPLLPLPGLLLLHLGLGTAFTYGWRALHYRICEALGLFHMVESGQVWDVYIPFLFYALQFGVFHIYRAYHRLQAQQAREAALQKLALEQELSALKAQLNPHFLYNTLNTISASVPPDQERTRVMIARLGDMFRYILRAARQETVSLAEELTFVEDYLALEQERFGERLQYTLEVTPGLMQRQVPPMLLQPLVENAVKHGISPKIEGGTLHLRVTAAGDRIRVLIADTGVGLQGQQPDALLHKGVGLANTATRLEKMYGATLHIQPAIPVGLEISFEIPVHEPVVVS